MQGALFEAPQTFDRCEVPTNSPWGHVDYSKEYAPGIWLVGTPSHGGFKLSPQRNKKMPACFRLKGKRGFYEEDCAWSLVALAFPEAFQPKDHEAAISTAKTYYPDEYELFTGTVIPLAESYKKRQRAFYAEVKDKLVTISAWGNWAKFVPDGMVGICATVGGSRHYGAKARWFLVPDPEYTGHEFGFAIDPSRHAEISAPADDQLRGKRDN
jgi:hypothetical protein